MNRPLKVRELVDLLAWADDEADVWIDANDENNEDSVFRFYPVGIAIEMTVPDNNTGEIAEVIRRVVIR